MNPPAQRELAESLDAILAPLEEIRRRIDLKLAEESRRHRSDSLFRHQISVSRPFILHRRQWERLTLAYSHVIRHIKDVLMKILQIPLGALKTAMEAAERSFAECVAPHLHESVTEESKGASLTHDQVKELELWTVQKALKQALSSEVLQHHVDDLLTASMSVQEAIISNSPKSTESIYFHYALEDRLRKGSSDGWDAEDVASAEKFFDKCRRSRKIENSQLVLHRVRQQRGRGVSSKHLVKRLMVDSSQFSGDSEPLGEGANGVVRQKKWKFDNHLVAIKKVSRETEEVATHVKVHHPNLLPLLCCTYKSVKRPADEEFDSYDDAGFDSYHTSSSGTTNYNTSSSGTTNYYTASSGTTNYATSGTTNYYTSTAELSTRNKVLRIVMERMDCNLKYLIKSPSKGRSLSATGNNGAERDKEATATPFSPFSLGTAVEIMLQIAKGMEYLHMKGIMHRDLKPENVLVKLEGSCMMKEEDEEGRRLRLRVKIADFGVSKESNSVHTATHTAKVGTSFYRAPEVMDGEEDVHNVGRLTSKYKDKVDVYSFSMVCYYILTGKPPFDKKSYSGALLNKIRNDGHRPSFTSHLPLALVDMIKHCWNPKPSDRPDFGLITNYLRFLKICSLQLDSFPAPPNDLPPTAPDPHLLSLLLREQPLLSHFRSHNKSSRLSHMLMECRRLLECHRNICLPALHCVSSGLQKGAAVEDQQVETPSPGGPATAIY